MSVIKVSTKIKPTIPEQYRAHFEDILSRLNNSHESDKTKKEAQPIDSNIKDIIDVDEIETTPIIEISDDEDEIIDNSPTNDVLPEADKATINEEEFAPVDQEPFTAASEVPKRQGFISMPIVIITSIILISVAIVFQNMLIQETPRMIIVLVCVIKPINN